MFNFNIDLKDILKGVNDMATGLPAIRFWALWFLALIVVLSLGIAVVIYVMK